MSNKNIEISTFKSSEEGESLKYKSIERTRDTDPKPIRKQSTAVPFNFRYTKPHFPLKMQPLYLF